MLHMVKKKTDLKTPTKLNLKASDVLWNKVLKYKIDKKFNNVNDAVVDILERFFS